MERKLATIQTITDLKPIPGADAIEVAQVLGWKCVVKRNEFKVGDKCAYFEIDSLLPVADWTDFLRKGEQKPFRLRSITLRKQLSQGLALPLNKLPLAQQDWSIGQEVTSELGVTKYEPVIPPELAGVCKGNFPSFIPKTDELRLQSFPDLVAEVRGKRMRGTLKMDGTSLTTFARGDQFGVCSRNMELVESETNAYWRIVHELGLNQRMPRGYALQGELAGPSIQGNRIGLTKPTLFAFSLLDLATGKFLNHSELILFCNPLGIDVVPLVFDGIIDPTWGVQEFLDFADKQVYQNGLPAEGVVWRPYEEKYSDVLNGRLSFKTISNRFIQHYRE